MSATRYLQVGSVLVFTLGGALLGKYYQEKLTTEQNVRE
jgi:hypothetical protein